MTTTAQSASRFNATSTMDIPRPDQTKKRQRRRVIYAVSAAAVLGLITLGLSRLRPAAPSVDRTSIVIETVKRGPLVREVRGPGTLVPEEIRWVPAQNAGRIERINVLPGAAVKSDTILVELSDPVLEQAVLDAQFAVKASEAELANLRVQVENDRLTLQASAATAQANAKQAQVDFEVSDALAKQGLLSQVLLKQSQAKSEELRKLGEIEQERLQMGPESAKARLASAQAKLDQLRATYELKLGQVKSLKVRAGIDGVLQKLGDESPLQVGQQMPAGAPIAKIANPAKLKAEIRIAETQAKDLELGQAATIDTRNGLIPGRVVHIDPAAQNGTVLVDVALDGGLPKGARPDLSVDGTIQLEKLEDTIFVGKPVQAQPDSQAGVFKLVNGGKEAVRVPVQFGSASVTAIVVRNGLQAGDQIIVSDMSQWDAHDKLRLN